MKIALAMIVKGDVREAQYLERCLKNMAPYVDAIYITATYRSDAQEAIPVSDVVDKFSKKHNAHISYFKWPFDFAAARNFNFSQVPKEYDYIMWSDADDVWRGLEKLRATIERHNSIDAFGFWYYYDWDEDKKPIVVHKKTMVVKNDGCTTWMGKLHEELEGTRELDTQLIEGIERLHLSDDEERRLENSKRNLEIAQLDVKMSPDDPRSYWNLANSQYGVSDYDGAIQTFTKFLQQSESTDEKYLARCRLADVYKSTGDLEAAVKELQMAIGTLPTIPDAFLQMGYLYYTFGNYDKAEEYILQGLVKKPQIHKMIVYNPRDYDYNPMMLLAQVYYHKNRPDLMLPLLNGCLKIYPKDEKLKSLVKEGTADKRKLARALFKVKDLHKIKDKKKLKTALDKLPADIKSHPAVAVIRNTNFIKEDSTGRDLVIYCGQTNHEWSPMRGFIGGSEEAIINLSRELAKLGWNVTVYNNCGHKEIYEEGEGWKVTYKPFWLFNYRDKCDVFITWRWCKPLDAEINSPKIFVDLHDVIPEGEFNAKRLARVTKIFVKSKFHRSLFPGIPNEKFAVIPNGIDLSLLDTGEKRDPNLIINTSSPDRSLDVLPKLFAQVKEKYPKAKMKWAYGWELFDRQNANDQKKMKWGREVRENMKAAGIEDLGRLSQKEIGKLYQQASILAYPTEFAEIDCISVRKAQAAGCLPIATDFGALAESIEFGEMVHSRKTKDTWNKPYQYHFGLEDPRAQKEWVEAVVYRLKNPSKFNPTEWRKSLTRQTIAARWNEVLLH